MTFDPRAHINASASRAEAKAWEVWTDELFDRFDASPEGRALDEDARLLGIFLQLAHSYHDAFLDTLTEGDVESMLLHTFPRKVVLDPDEAGGVVQELRAFFTFCGREFGLQNMPECLKVLTPRLERTFRSALGDTRNFGMAKSFMTGGAIAGFNMQTQAGLDAWAAVQNQMDAPRKPDLQRPSAAPRKNAEPTPKKKPRRGGGL
jgi:hypothetical protein